MPPSWAPGGPGATSTGSSCGACGGCSWHGATSHCSSPGPTTYPWWSVARARATWWRSPGAWPMRTANACCWCWPRACPLGWGWSRAAEPASRQSGPIPRSMSPGRPCRWVRTGTSSTDGRYGSTRAWCRLPACWRPCLARCSSAAREPRNARNIHSRVRARWLQGKAPTRAPAKAGRTGAGPMNVPHSRRQDSLEHESASPDTVAIVLAGGEGRRLRPLTARQCKPAVPFVGATRIVDFAIANLANSGIRRIFVLAQYKPDTLVDHLRRHSSPLFAAGGRVLRVLVPRSDAPEHRFVGTADAVAKTRDQWLALDPSRVAVFAADHVYRMDIAQMI